MSIDLAPLPRAFDDGIGVNHIDSSGRAIFRLEKTNARAPDPTGWRPPVDLTGHHHNLLRLRADI